MVKNLVIVESPAKAKTIERYLGSDYKVVASFGHVRDLPKSKLGIDVADNFKPDYMIPRGSAKKINELKKLIHAAETIYLATDLDREGEAIAWHITEAIPPGPKQSVKRITFSEITQAAIKDAVAHPRQINRALVDAQQARRVLDRLVGYSLSPVLWKKIRYGLSAGRVQSVALKLIVDREREIEAFRTEEYWSIEVLLSSNQNLEFKAELIKIAGQKAVVSDEKSAKQIKDELQKSSYRVIDVTSRQIKKQASPPFITSTLQQAAYGRLGYGTRRTMMIAQNLYEAGHISYMRTDSTNFSQQAITQVRSVIEKKYGKNYLPASPNFFRKKAKGAQEAHEAIRPTDFKTTPDQLAGSLKPEEAKLYKLVWERAVASQMNPAQYQQNGIDIETGQHQLRASGRVVLFDGFTKVWSSGKEDQSQTLPELKAKDPLRLISITPDQHFTQPPPRYSEASLVKILESEGVGRPSTYAPTISTLISRGYVASEDKRLVPQQIGIIVSDLLSKNFEFVTEPEFTAEMESKLDDIADGKSDWQPIVGEFYEPMEKLVEEKTNSIERVKIPVIETDEKCELCGKPMVIKSGRFGQFLACSGFPECKNTKPIIKSLGITCPKCKKGEIIEKRTKKNRKFYGCSRYPDCDYASWKKPVKPKDETD